ncbi:MAG: GNAT family N-acetyltransferase [Pseudonocardia sp.]
MRWTVRVATPGDVAAVASIHVRAWRAAYRGMVPDEALDGLVVDRSAERWMWMVTADADESHVFLAVDGSRTGAFCSVCPVRLPERDAHPQRPTGELVTIYADPAWAGTGAGSAVHDAGLEHLASRGFGHVVLWVLEANQPARSFYAHRGWSVDDVRDDFEIGGRRLTEVRYSRRLEPCDRVGASRWSTGGR